MTKEEKNAKRRADYAKNASAREYQRTYSNENRWKYKTRIKAYWKEYGRSLSYKYSYYKSNAKKRGFIFPLTHIQFDEIVHLPCSYCGTPASPLHGIDRRDNQKGYEVDNCYSCCTQCNRMKMDSSVEDFIRKCADIVNFTKNIQL